MGCLIGISCNVDDDRNRLRLNRDYLFAVEQSGGVPLILAGSGETARAVISRVDGVVLSGGVDVDPRHFGEEPHPELGEVSAARDEFELALAEEALRRGVPVLGICRGSQVMAIVGGGSLYQDLPSQRPGGIQHYQKGARSRTSHLVALSPKSRLTEILGGQREVRVNSFHHQAVRSLPEGWDVSATSSDGVIEAFEYPDHPFWLAVQWHPEILFAEDAAARALFANFVQSVEEVSQGAR